MEEYDELLKQIEKPVIISFNAIWSPPCQRMNPIYDAHVPDYPEIIMKRCDVDDREDVQDKAGNNAMPTYMYFLKGAEVERIEGANEEGLKTLLEKAKVAAAELIEEAKAREAAEAAEAAANGEAAGEGEAAANGEAAATGEAEAAGEGEAATGD